MNKVIFFYFSVAFAAMVMLTSTSCKENMSGHRLSAQTPVAVVTEELLTEPAFPMPNAGEVWNETLASFITEEWQMVGVFPGYPEDMYVWVAYRWILPNGAGGFALQFEPDFPIEDVLSLVNTTAAVGYEKQTDNRTNWIYVQGETEGAIHEEIMTFMNAALENMAREGVEYLDWQSPIGHVTGLDDTVLAQ